MPREILRRYRLIFFCLLAAAMAACGSGCAHTRRQANLGKIYNEIVQSPDHYHNPVIVIPGILGSRLVDEKTGKVVWGSFDSDAIDPNSDEGARLVALPMAEGAPLSELHDDVRPDGALGRLRFRLFGWPVEVDAYAQMLASLGVGGFRDPSLYQAGGVQYGDHFTCYQFDYDWRRDVSENAARLHQFILQKRTEIRDEYRRRYGVDSEQIKFDIVAHSMGGLMTRYYLRYGPQPLPADGTQPRLTWEGSRHVQHAILVAPPNAGAAMAFSELLFGDRPALILPKYSAALLGTMPAIYQLLPRPRHGVFVDVADRSQRVDIYDPQLWQRLNWGLANPAQDKTLRKLLPGVEDRESRRRIAIDHQSKCLALARQLHEALDVPAAPPPGLSIHLFAGDTIDTDSVIGIDLETGKVKLLEKAPGDGIVTRASALLDERVGNPQIVRFVSPVAWTSKTFLDSDHRSLPRENTFTNNVLSLLLESQATHGNPRPDSRPAPSYSLPWPLSNAAHPQ